MIWSNVDAFFPSFLQLLDVCLQLGSKDNMTALVVKFKPQVVGEGGGVTARRQARDAHINQSGHTSEDNDEDDDEAGSP